MAAWRYEIFLLVLKIFHLFAALTHEIFFTMQIAVFVLYLGSSLLSSVTKKLGGVLLLRVEGGEGSEGKWQSSYASVIAQISH